MNLHNTVCEYLQMASWEITKDFQNVQTGVFETTVTAAFWSVFMCSAAVEYNNVKYSNL